MIECIIMFEEKISTEFGMKNIDETTNDVIEEINQNELMSKKNKIVYGVLNYMEHYSYWMHFHLWFCFFCWYSYRNY